MKKILTLFIIGMWFSGISQISYTQSDGPRVGIKTFSRNLTEVNSFNLSQLMETGGNKTWDLRGASEEGDEMEFVAVDDLPFKSKFPGCNMASVEVPNPDDSYLMYERSTDGIFLLGSADDQSEIVLSPKFTIIPFPLNFGSNFQNNSSAEFMVDTITFKMNIQSNATVDAWGMLTTNDGTYPVLKMKTVRITETAIGGIPFGSTSFTYSWVTSGLANPLATLEISEDETPFGLTNDTTMSYTQKQEVVATNDLKKQINRLKISPNPVTDHVTIQTDGLQFKSAIYSIINADGKSIKEGKLQTNEILHLNLQSLSSGNYLIQMVLDNQTMLFDIFSKK